jgi:5-(carboxyamino)imidazole ribonucleotide synthase
MDPSAPPSFLLPSFPLVGPPRVGIVGGGQLAMMLRQAADAAGADVRVLARPADESVRGAGVTIGEATIEDLVPFAATVDVVTFENEKIPPDALEAMLAAGATLRPSAAALTFTDKASQRRHLRELGFPVPPFVVCASPAEVADATERLGYPVMIKSARDGYDGKGVARVDARSELDTALASIPAGTIVVEPFLTLERELAVLVARRPGGDHVVYPVVETVQVDGMCREACSPAPISAALTAEAHAVGLGVAEALDVVGLIAVELFVVDGTVLVNELALRVHNSGHLTIEASGASQFENHLRAVLDLPLGTVTSRAPVAVMVNIIGADDPHAIDPRDSLPEVELDADTFVHLYDKTPRPGRKIGHVTVLGSDPTDLDRVRRRAWHTALALGGAPAGAPDDHLEIR